MKLRMCIAFLLLGLASLTQAADRALTLGDDQTSGVITKIDHSKGTLVVNGLRFNLDPGLQVEIDGTYGAFNMLQKGMKVGIDFYHYSNTEREAFVIRQLPASVVTDEA